MNGELVSKHSFIKPGFIPLCDYVLMDFHDSAAQCCRTLKKNLKPLESMTYFSSECRRVDKYICFNFFLVSSQSD